jgi:uncharacterized membrane protein YeaQ/YmgE (transglycosylase-associated protein family)
VVPDGAKTDIWNKNSAGTFYKTRVRRERRSNAWRHSMNLLACIAVGILAGWLAERITGRDHGLLTNLFVGILGSLIGGVLFTGLMGFRYDDGFNLASIAAATVGAVILLLMFGGIRSRRTTS